MGNCVNFRVQIVFFAAVQFFWGRKCKKKLSALCIFAVLLYAFLQELDSKNAFSYKILQEFL